MYIANLETILFYKLSSILKPGNENLIVETPLFRLIALNPPLGIALGPP